MWKKDIIKLSFCPIFSKKHTLSIIIERINMTKIYYIIYYPQ